MNRKKETIDLNKILKAKSAIGLRPTGVTPGQYAVAADDKSILWYAGRLTKKHDTPVLAIMPDVADVVAKYIDDNGTNNKSRLLLHTALHNNDNIIDDDNKSSSTNIIKRRLERMIKKTINLYGKAPIIVLDTRYTKLCQRIDYCTVCKMLANIWSVASYVLTDDDTIKHDRTNGTYSYFYDLFL